MDQPLLTRPWTLAAVVTGATMALCSASAWADSASSAEWAEGALRIAQLPRYSASGLHQCGSGAGTKQSCVVTGLFSDCNDAMMSLQTRDCCPTTKGGGTSTGFTLSYCIPDISGR
jgi:hypothetical protein